MTTKTTKTTSKRTTKSQESTTNATTQQAQPQQTETKRTTKRTSRKEPEPVQQEPVPQADHVEDEQQESSEPKQRRVPTRETVETEFDALVDAIRTEIESIRSSTDKKKGTGVKFLRQVGKRLKLLKSDTLRVSKQRQRSNRQKNTTSGFMKQVPISKEMAKFANWEPSQLRSRVEVTKFICDYVKQHNLQNPQDRRQILPDDKLSKLLNFDAKKSDKPLTYYYLQRVIQPHFNATASK
jgi:chromatin remodeling complex protein RSC6